MLKVGIITASDKGARGERDDISGKRIEEMLSGLGEVGHYLLAPDDEAVLRQGLIHMSDELDLDVVFTTGGTGLGPRDVTPEATLAVIQRPVPGIAEAMRARSLEKTDRAMLSRAVSGVRGRTLIINLPGSPKAVEECLEVVLPVLEHAVSILRGRESECARH